MTDPVLIFRMEIGRYIPFRMLSVAGNRNMNFKWLKHEERSLTQGSKSPGLVNSLVLHVIKHSLSFCPSALVS